LSAQAKAAQTPTPLAAIAPMGPPPDRNVAVAAIGAPAPSLPPMPPSAAPTAPAAATAAMAAPLVSASAIPGATAVPPPRYVPPLPRPYASAVPMQTAPATVTVYAPPPTSAGTVTVYPPYSSQPVIYYYRPVVRMVRRVPPNWYYRQQY